MNKSPQEMGELEAVLRLILGVSLVDGRIQESERQRLKAVALSVNAGPLLEKLLVEVSTVRFGFENTHDLVQWARPAAERLAYGSDQVKFMARYTLDRFAAIDGTPVDHELSFTKAIGDIIGRAEGPPRDETESKSSSPKRKVTENQFFE